MIVLDASVLVSAAMGRGSVPDRAVRHAFASDRVAMSEPMMADLLDVFAWPRLARFLLPGLLDEITNSWSRLSRPARRRSSAATMTCLSCILGVACGFYCRPAILPRLGRRTDGGGPSLPVRPAALGWLHDA